MKIVFIVPYRNRQRDKGLFLENMEKILKDDTNTDTNTYEIYFAHQYDNRPFNRGAMKNIGFLAIKRKYPDTYKDITFVFNDVDTWPAHKGLIDYNTINGIVKHFYGFKFALGGIFSIKGSDFEKCNGFPNFWGWGLEDNTLNDRCLSAGLIIDRSCFYDIHNPLIVRAFDGYQRIISKRDSVVYKFEKPDNLNTIINMNWNFQDVDSNIKVTFINITSFDCMIDPNIQTYETFDIRKSNKIKIPKLCNFRRSWKLKI